MEQMSIIKEVVRLISVKCVQEIAIWKNDTDVLLLDGTCEHYKWGCACKNMHELTETLKELLKGAGYLANREWFTVSYDCVRIILSKDSEIRKNFVETHPVNEESEEGRKGIICVKIRLAGITGLRGLASRTSTNKKIYIHFSLCLKW